MHRARARCAEAMQSQPGQVPAAIFAQPVNPITVAQGATGDQSGGKRRSLHCFHRCNQIYRFGVRGIPRVKAFIKFDIEVFQEVKQVRGGRVVASARPSWLRRHYQRSSAVMAQS